MTTAFEEYSKSGGQLGDIHVPGGKAPRPDDFVQMANIGDDWTQIRFYPRFQLLSYVWVDTRKMDGTYTQIPRLSRNMDPKTAHPDKRDCPYMGRIKEFTNHGNELSLIHI